METYEHLPTDLPEEKGISSYHIGNLLNIMELENIEIHHMMIAVDGEVIFKVMNDPYREDIPHIVHSLTKAFTNTAVAKAYSEGLLDLNDKVVDFFEDEAEKYLPENPSQNLLEMTVENLITMRSGHGREISGSEWRPLKTSWIKAFFDEPVPHVPGEYYCYSSGNSYMLSAIVQKITGLTAHDYLRDGFLDKLGLREFTWDKSPEGINSGGNGISLCIEDIMKLGIIYQQNGKWNDEQLIDEAWVDRAFGRIDRYEPDAGEPAYNYHWYQYGDLYSASGIFGQNCMVIPKLNMVVGVTAATKDWEIVPKAVNEHFIKPHIEGKIIKKDVSEILINKAFRMNLMSEKDSIPNYPKFSIREEIYYVTETHEDNISEISFRQLHDEKIIFAMKDHRGSHTVECKIGEWNYGTTGITGNYLHHQYQPDQAIVVSYAWWETPTLLCMEWRYPEMAFCDYLTFQFSNDFKNVEMNRKVNVNTQDMKRKPLSANRKINNIN